MFSLKTRRIFLNFCPEFLEVDPEDCASASSENFLCCKSDLKLMLRFFLFYFIGGGRSNNTLRFRNTISNRLERRCIPM